MATPIYRPSFAPAPCIPPVRMLNRHSMFLEGAGERIHFRRPLVEKCFCSCSKLKVRSRSLENLCPSDVTTTTTTTEREETYFRRRKKLGKENFKRRSMDNLLDNGKHFRKKVRK